MIRSLIRAITEPIIPSAPRAEVLDVEILGALWAPEGCICEAISIGPEPNRVRLTVRTDCPAHRSRPSRRVPESEEPR